MVYTLTKRIYRNNEFYGYQIMSKTGETLNCDLTSILMLSHEYMLKYKGKHVFDGSVRFGEIEELPIEYTTVSKTRHQRARDYELKLKLLGDTIQYNFEYLPFDRVRLIRVYSEKPIKKLVIPSFVTNFRTNSKAGIIPISFKVEADEIYIDNDPEVFIDASYMFSRKIDNIEHLTLEFKHPEMLIRADSMFESNLELKEINLLNFKTTNLRSTERMFKGCYSLKRINLGGMDTSSVVNMADMFVYCEELLELDLSSFNTSNVTTFKDMFRLCTYLKHLDLSNFDTSNSKDFSRMFSSCTSLLELNISNFDTSNATTLYGMFQECENLENIDVSRFNTSNVKEFNRMFKGCENLKNLDTSNFDTSKGERFNYMFYGCQSLTTINLENFNFDLLLSADGMFKDSGFIKLDLSMFHGVEYFGVDDLVKGCRNLRELDIRNMRSSIEKDIGLAFCEQLQLLDLRNIDIRSIELIKGLIEDSHATEIILNKELIDDADIYNKLINTFRDRNIQFV